MSTVVEPMLCDSPTCSQLAVGEVAIVHLEPASLCATRAGCEAHLSLTLTNWSGGFWNCIEHRSVAFVCEVIW